MLPQHNGNSDCFAVLTSLMKKARVAPCGKVETILCCGTVETILCDGMVKAILCGGKVEAMLVPSACSVPDTALRTQTAGMVGSLVFTSNQP